MIVYAVIDNNPNTSSYYAGLFLNNDQAKTYANKLQSKYDEQLGKKNLPFIEIEPINIDEYDNEGICHMCGLQMAHDKNCQMKKLFQNGAFLDDKPSDPKELIDYIKAIS